MKKETLLNSKFVKNYYNESLSALDENYTNYRWHRNKVSEYDYQQTKNTLLHILKKFNIKDNHEMLEVGPGDGVWTPLFINQSEHYTVLEQSEEMISRLQANFKENKFSVIKTDFMEYEPEQTFDTVFAIRCFEYFDKKEKALKIFKSALGEHSLLIITTKNASYIKSVKKSKKLHSEQITSSQMAKIAEVSGLEMIATYPTTLRVKSTFKIFRAIFTMIHNLGLLFNNAWFNNVFNWATESYTYVLRKK